MSKNYVPPELAMEKDAESTDSDLSVCYQSVANLRSALLAAAALMDKAGLHKEAAAVWAVANAADLDTQRAALRTLEEDAGYIASMGPGECRP